MDEDPATSAYEYSVISVDGYLRRDVDPEQPLLLQMMEQAVRRAAALGRSGQQAEGNNSATAIPRKMLLKAAIIEIEARCDALHDSDQKVEGFVQTWRSVRDCIVSTLDLRATNSQPNAHNKCPAGLNCLFFSNSPDHMEKVLQGLRDSYEQHHVRDCFAALVENFLARIDAAIDATPAPETEQDLAGNAAVDRMSDLPMGSAGMASGGMSSFASGQRRDVPMGSLRSSAASVRGRDEPPPREEALLDLPCDPVMKRCIRRCRSIAFYAAVPGATLLMVVVMVIALIQEGVLAALPHIIFLVALLITLVVRSDHQTVLSIIILSGLPFIGTSALAFLPFWLISLLGRGRARTLHIYALCWTVSGILRVVGFREAEALAILVPVSGVTSYIATVVFMQAYEPLFRDIAETRAIKRFYEISTRNFIMGTEWGHVGPGWDPLPDVGRGADLSDGLRVRLQNPLLSGGSKPGSLRNSADFAIDPTGSFGSNPRGGHGSDSMMGSGSALVRSFTASQTALSTPDTDIQRLYAAAATALEASLPGLASREHGQSPNGAALRPRAGMRKPDERLERSLSHRMSLPSHLTVPRVSIGCQTNGDGDQDDTDDFELRRLSVHCQTEPVSTQEWEKGQMGLQSLAAPIPAITHSPTSPHSDASVGGSPSVFFQDTKPEKRPVFEKLCVCLLVESDTNCTPKRFSRYRRLWEAGCAVAVVPTAAAIDQHLTSVDLVLFTVEEAEDLTLVLLEKFVSAKATDIVLMMTEEVSAQVSAAYGPVLRASLNMKEPNLHVLMRPHTTNDLLHFLTSIASKRLAQHKMKSDIALVRKALVERSLPWKKGRLLGRGTHGKVFEAETQKTGGTVAVKILTATNNDQVIKIIKEIDLMCKLHHPNIIHYFYCEKKGSDLLLFMEYARGGSLSHMIANKHPLPLEFIADCLQDVMAGLRFLHDNNIVHRDLKPANILIGDQQQCKIADFGCALELEIAATPDFATSGTVLYMAPEVLRGRKHGWPVDIWSLGCVVMELMSGVLPFRHIGNQMQVMQTLLRSEALSPPLGDLDSVYRGSEEARGFVALCLKTVPHTRPSCAELAAHPLFTTFRGPAVPRSAGSLEPATGDQSMW